MNSNIKWKVSIADKLTNQNNQKHNPISTAVSEKKPYYFLLDLLTELFLSKYIFRRLKELLKTILWNV